MNILFIKLMDKEKTKVAIYNPHIAPNITSMGIHNYIIKFIRDGHTPYIFIEDRKSVV